MPGRWPDDIRPEGLSNPDYTPGQQQIAAQIAERKRQQRAKLITAVLLLCVGGILVGVGAGFAWGWPVGLFAGGLTVLVVAVLIGLSE